MSSTFSGLSTALSSLHAQRRAMETVGQNIANVNTEGYSRQRVQMQAVEMQAPGRYAIYDGAGEGVTITDIQRLRDGFMEDRGRVAHSQAAFLDSRQQVYTRIEQVFAEPSDTALASQLDDFWAGWSEVANRPGDEAVRSQLLERGRVVADGLRGAYEGLDSQWDGLRGQLEGFASDVNSAASAVAELNSEIVKQRNSGMPANELSDLRDVKLMELATLTGATAVTQADGTVDVTLGGASLVNGSTARQLVVTGSQQLAGQSTDPVTLRWDGAAGPGAAITGGRIAGSLDALGTTIPGLADKLDAVAAKLADSVNTVHQAGYPMDGAATAGAFFSPDPGPVTARNITVAITDPRDLGVSNSPGTLDGSNAVALGALGEGSSGADGLYSRLVVELGVNAQAAQRRADIQTRVTADVDTLRSAESGVNLDEEITNMISYQRAYEAASRVLNAIDEALDVLVNRTGLVGR